MFRFVLLISFLNLFNYAERFLLSASLAQVKADLGLSDLQSGALFSSFVLPYIGFAFLLSLYSERINKAKALKWSCWIWGVAAALSAFAQNFVHLALTRSLLGIGEAAFATIAPVAIMAASNRENQGRMMSIFSAGLPLGMALGFIGGGWLTGALGWRMGYLALAVPAIALAIAFSKTDLPTLASSQVSKPILEEFKDLVNNLPYRFTLFGFIAYVYVAGGVTHWMPTFIQQAHGLSVTQANLIFGGAAIGFGLLGTIVGGWWSDQIEKKSKNGALKVASYSMLLAVLPFIFVFYSRTTTSLFVWIAITQFFFFLSTSPMNVAVLNSVKPTQASTAMALVILFSHLLGDAISAPLIGHLSDSAGDLRLAILSTVPVLILSGLLWGMQAFRSMKSSSP